MNTIFAIVSKFSQRLPIIGGNILEKWQRRSRRQKRRNQSYIEGMLAALESAMRMRCVSGIAFTIMNVIRNSKPHIAKNIERKHLNALDNGIPGTRSGPKVTFIDGCEEILMPFELSKRVEKPRNEVLGNQLLRRYSGML